MKCSIVWIFALLHVAVSIDLLRLELHKQLNNLKKQLFDTETKVEELRAAEEKLDMIRISVRVFSHEVKKEFSRSIDTSFGMNDRKEQEWYRSLGDEDNNDDDEYHNFGNFTQKRFTNYAFKWKMPKN